MYDFSTSIRLDKDSIKDFNFHETYDEGESFFVVSTSRGDKTFIFKMIINFRTMNYEIYDGIPKWIKDLENRLSDSIKRHIR